MTARHLYSAATRGKVKDVTVPKIETVLSKAIGSALKLPIVIYRYTFKPFVGHSCRHLPTCSEYALDAIDKNGPWRGFWLTVSRLSRCQPWWGTHGFDPAPDIRAERHPFWAPWRYGRWSAAQLPADPMQESGASR